MNVIWNLGDTGMVFVVGTLTRKLALSFKWRKNKRNKGIERSYLKSIWIVTKGLHHWRDDDYHSRLISWIVRVMLEFRMLFFRDFSRWGIDCLEWFWMIGNLVLLLWGMGMILRSSRRDPIRNLRFNDNQIKCLLVSSL